MPRKAKLFSFRKPKVRITKKGLRVTSPSARIGGKSGLNISKSGLSYSIRTKLGTWNSKRSCSSAMMFVISISLIIAGTLIVVSTKM